jgi:hypothetical protein
VCPPSGLLRGARAHGMRENGRLRAPPAQGPSLHLLLLLLRLLLRLLLLLLLLLLRDLQGHCNLLGAGLVHGVLIHGVLMSPSTQ